MSTQTVLFDVPGPKARRRHLVLAMLAVAALLALLAAAAFRLHDRGQLDSELWAPLLDPTHEDFSAVWEFLWRGLQATLVTAALAITASLIIGTALGSARMLLGTTPVGRGVRLPLIVWIELFRGLPVVITIFLTWAFFRFVDLRLDFLPGDELMWYVAIGLTLYNSVIIAEILRAGVASLPRGQAEAARAVGMTEGKVMRLVLLPQAFRIMLPALISQLVVVLKDTSLGFVISYIELLYRGNRLGQLYHNPLQALLVVAIIYIAINMLLSWIAVRVERRASRHTAAKKAPMAVETGMGGAAA